LGLYHQRAIFNASLPCSDWCRCVKCVRTARETREKREHRNIIPLKVYLDEQRFS
jgi:hypothetical protein